MIYIDFVRA